MARQPVKVTYAHKRGRAKAAAKLTSSPLEDLSTDRDDITRSEMSRRMLKRSRQISHEDDEQMRNKNHPVKRARKTVQVAHPDVLPGADIITFQTPFPSAEYIHPTSVTRPLVPEDLSPVPYARRIVSRTSSRNLKENSSLASPFHSRPSSPHSPPTSKAKERLHRVPLHSKSRTLPGALQKTDSTYARRIPSRKDSIISLNDGKLSRQVSLNDSRLSRRHAAPSLNKLVRNSPSKHQRYTSSLNSSYMLSHIAQQDWASPQKSLMIHAGNRGPDPELLIRPNPIENSSTSSFLIDRPQFFSTPQHRISDSRTGLYAPVSPSRLAFLTHSPRDARDEDVEMANYTELPEIPKVYIPRNSIISSSGSFTLRTCLISTALDVSNDPEVHDSAGSEPMSISTDVLPQKISMGNYMVPLASSAPYLDMPNPKPHGKISLGQNVIPLPGTSPLVSSTPPVVSSHTAIGKQRIAFPMSSPGAPDSPRSTARNAGECVANMPLPLLPTRRSSSSGTSNVRAPSEADLVQDMLSLGLGGRNHDAGVQGTQPPTRTRSLDSPPGITSKKASTTKHKRNRAGTIRASDLRPANSGTGAPVTSLTSTVTGPAGGLPGRTRSGTVVGPNSKFAVRPHSKGAVKRRPAVPVMQHDASGGSVDELAISNVHQGWGPWSSEDLIDLAQRGRNKGGMRKVIHDDITSDDPLLIVGPWRDEDWL
ncbi:hypothetical protein K503DRAFT_798308 [Rhizopogon vinicolor AM-OR11-026]|uniref:Uncharacterized protein n=1 Tax=Rhizopogon vinicolor AM-OR11-026 TaxID=1314800 RepID=A0A1B7N861_9AGAM|nr:hypothetical protein K503DRAFT_798308 [Rhizopogon vinicolor AM-OR11-026]